MIRLESVNKIYDAGKYGQTHAVKDASIVFPQCGMVAVCGKSGSGKTTLLNAIGGLISINSGEIFFDGINVTAEGSSARLRRVGYIFQNYCLSEERSVYDNVADALRIDGIRDEEIIRFLVDEALSIVSMQRYSERFPQELSGGQQQRVAIARAIVKSPSVVLADEPTANLDEDNKEIVMKLLRIISRKCLVIIVTHNDDIVNKYCDGRIIVCDGELSELMPNYVQIDALSDNDSEKTFGKVTDAINTLQALCSSEMYARKNNGKLFSWKNSVKRGWLDTVGNKTGQKALRWCLFFASVLFGVVSARLGMVIREFGDVGKQNNENVYYGYINNVASAKQLEQVVESGFAGLDGMTYFETPIGGDSSMLLLFRDYENSLLEDWNRTIMLIQHGAVLPESMIVNKGLKGCGKCSGFIDNEVAVTTAMAEQIANGNRLSMLSTPESLIGFEINGLETLRIVGIIESAESAVYVSDTLFSKWRYNHEYPDVNLKICNEAEEGSVVLIRNTPLTQSEEVNVNDYVIINGRELLVSKIIDAYYPYEYWLSEFIEEPKQSLEEYINNTGKTEYDYWDYYLMEFRDYLNYCKEHKETVYFDRCMEMACSGNKYAEYYLKEEITNLTDYYYATMFKDNNYRYPLDNELSACYEEYPELISHLEEVCGQELIERVNNITYKMCSKDYIACATSFGETCGYGLRHVSKPTGYAILHTSNCKDTEEFVKEWFVQCDQDGFAYMSPMQNAKDRQSQLLREHTISFIMFALMLVAVVFILYMVVGSNLMKKEKTLIIYRCIGVTKRNIAFRYCVETMMSIAMTAGIGAIVSGIALVLLQRGGFGVLLKGIVYYSWPACVGIMVLLLLIGFILCLIAISVFIHKEPGDLLD